MKMAINEEQEIEYMFYRKPQSNKFTMMARSALPDKVKRSTLTNEALRRLLCCSPNLAEQKKVKVSPGTPGRSDRSACSGRNANSLFCSAGNPTQTVSFANKLQDE